MGEIVGTLLPNVHISVAIPDSILWIDREMLEVATPG